MLESFEVASTVPCAGRPYAWVCGTAQFAVDPLDAANARIVDLPEALRDPDGRVRFDADVRMLRPTAERNGRALVVIPNRGMLGGVPFSLDAETAMDATAVPDPGDGLLLDRGWTIAWCGWQFDVLRDGGWLGLSAPAASVGPGWLRVEFRPDQGVADHRLSDSSLLFRFQDYPPVELDDAEAKLYVRTTPMGHGRLLPRAAWSFTDDARVVLDGGFQAFHYYELVYRSAFAPVVGCGLLAVRDFSSWLGRHHDALFGFGVSQSGRFLRQFLFDGLNVDEAGRQVFDGVLTHLAGARRGEFNCRFGQPSLTHPVCAAYGPPYDTQGLLERQRALGGVPKVIETNSSAEYWRGDGALLHQDPETGEDLPEDDLIRTYAFSGTDHLGAMPIKELLPVANPVHLLDVTPLLRALFRRLEGWVCDGTAPPPSAVVRRGDGSAVDRASVLWRFGVGSLPDVDHLPFTPAVDPRSTAVPIEQGRPAISLVSAVDGGGNEGAGIRLPAVALGVHAYTGWNPRVHVPGLPDVLYEFVGSRLPLQGSTDLPPRAEYQEQAVAVARHLVTEGFLLELDVERCVEEAMALFDAAQVPGG